MQRGTAYERASSSRACQPTLYPRCGISWPLEHNGSPIACLLKIFNLNSDPIPGHLHLDLSNCALKRLHAKDRIGCTDDEWCVPIFPALYTPPEYTLTPPRKRLCHGTCGHVWARVGTCGHVWARGTLSTTLRTLCTRLVLPLLNLAVT